MDIRSSRISWSVARAVSQDYDGRRSRSKEVARAIIAFFAIFRLKLACHRPADFLTLRHDVWQMDEDEYLRSFRASTYKSPHKRKGEGKGKSSAHETDLVAVGDLGYSGSAFFSTLDGKYLVKSLPRRSEYNFFIHELYVNYFAHMKRYPDSLLVRITDLVVAPHTTLGGLLGLAPTHHIIMENLLYGRDDQEEAAGSSSPDALTPGGWETYDLKPNSYFLPERDIANGRLVPESVRDKLFDEFPERVHVSLQMRRELLATLAEDTRLLEAHAAVDYSLFMVRYPGPRSNNRSRDAVPHVQARTPAWRYGIDDVDGKWTYRAVVLDFFWAKNRIPAKAMTGLVKAFNLFARKGPMSITADPSDYRSRFLRMVEEIVVASGSD